MHKTKKAMKDVLWSYTGTILNLGINVVLLPIILKYLDAAELGLWYIFASVGTTITLINFGFNPCIMRSVGHAWGEGMKSNIEEAKKNQSEGSGGDSLLGMMIAASKRLYVKLSVVVLLLAWIPGTVYIYSVIGTDMDIMYGIGAWLVYGLATACNLLFGYWGPILQGVGGVAEAQKVQVISKSVQLFLSFLGLSTGFGLWALAIAFLISGIISRGISKAYAIRYIGKDNIGSNKKTKNKQVEKALFANAGKFGIVSLSTQLVSQTYQMFCASYFGLAISSQYGLSVQIINLCIAMSSVTFHALFPRINITRVTHEIERRKELLSIGIVVQWVSSTFCIVGIVILGNRVLSFLSTEHSLLGTVELVLLAFVLLLENNRGCFTGYISTSNRLPYTKPVLASSIITISCAYLLALTTRNIKYLLIVRLLVECTYNGWKWMKVVMDELELYPIKMFRITLSKLLSISAHKQKF